MIAALEDYMEALRQGRPWPRDEFLARHAEIAEELEECLSGLDFIQTAGVSLGESPGPAAPLPPEPLAARAQLGDYRILREVGRGGMGVVYEAQQVSLGRRVALKVLPLAAAIDPKQRQRFQIEAQAAAQLHHPHIVPIFGVGCDQGIHYYAMQFVDGRSLAAIIRELRSGREAPAGASRPSVSTSLVSTEEASGSSADRRDSGPAAAARGQSGPVDRRDEDGSWDVSATGPYPPAGGPSRASAGTGSAQQGRDFCRNAARLGAEAAEALDHAHGLGILHRDIKPANLLIDPLGAVWITDFGLARFPGDLSLTGTGDMVGTLRYMSPEQAQARRGVVDQRTDIYSLGVTLYELLTLRPAFDGRDHQELLKQIATDEPVPPRRLNPAIPRDLETIVLKAMAKDLSHRYATAQELAADLRRFLADEPILARRPSAIERAVRWSRRHREIVATAAAVVVVSLAIGTTLMWAQVRKTKAAAAKAEAARNAYQAYIIESFPLIDSFTKDAIDEALRLALGQAGPARRDEGFQTFDQWLKILRQASDLPPNDRASRIITGRASTHLGYTRAMLSMARATDGRLEPTLLEQAKEDYRRSIALFEDLLAESPGDAKLRRYLADATGVFGMGCCFRFGGRNDEAESWYRRAVKLRRNLVRDPGGIDVRDREAIDGVVSNFTRLYATVQILASILGQTGRRAEVESMDRPLEEDIVALAKRFAGPEYQRLRMMLAQTLLGRLSPVMADGRRAMIQNCQWALILDPQNAQANNDLAWALTSVTDDPWFDSKQALELARKAVTLDPLKGDYWNTLGVAAYRVGDWKTAAESLQKSIQISGGTPLDCFVLAMTRWHQGKRDEARQWFDRAITGIERTRSEDPEVRRFHAEAAAVLGLPGPQPRPGTGGAPKAEATTENARQNDTTPGR
jgi:serine/threonine protein kinase